MIVIGRYSKGPKNMMKYLFY